MSHDGRHKAWGKPDDYVRDKRARGAADSIKSSTPAEMLGWGPRPGVERSVTPGTQYKKICKVREAADSGSSNVSFIELDTVRFQELNEFISK